MIRTKGQYRNQTLVWNEPLALREGAEREIEIRLAEEKPETEREDWAAVGIERLEQEWDSPEDAIYDDWKKLYGV